MVSRAGSRLRVPGFDSCYLRTFFEVYVNCSVSAKSDKAGKKFNLVGSMRIVWKLNKSGYLGNILGAEVRILA